MDESIKGYFESTDEPELIEIAKNWASLEDKIEDLICEYITVNPDCSPKNLSKFITINIASQMRLMGYVNE